MMRAQLDDVHARGEPLALLWASEDTIYGRFGYGMASQCAEVSIPRQHSAFARPLEREGTVQARRRRTRRSGSFPASGTPSGERRPACSRARATGGSTASSSRSRAAGEGAGPKRLVVLERDGRPEGYAIYRHKPKWADGISDSELQVVEAVALDGRPTAELWRYLLDIDWAARTTASLLPVDHPLWWLLATPRHMRPRVGDGLWVRLVDVGEALSARAYAADGAVVFDVIDEFCPWNAGRWRVARRAGEADDRRAAAPPRRERARLRLPRGASRSPSSCAEAGSRSCAAAPPRERTRCSRPSARPGVPRSSDAGRRCDGATHAHGDGARHRALHRDHGRSEPAALRRRRCSRHAASAGSSSRVA